MILDIMIDIFVISILLSFTVVMIIGIFALCVLLLKQLLEE